MTRRRSLPDGLPNHFAVAEAREAGVPRNRLDAQDLVAPFHGSRSARPIDVTSLAERCAAYLPVAPSHFAFSHGTAALLWGMPLPQGAQGTALHVSVPTHRTPPRRAGVIGHRGLGSVRTIRGLPVVPVESVWLQLGESLAIDELVVVADFLLRRKRPLSTMAALVAALDAAAGRRGVERCRAALIEVRSGTDSPQESVLRLVIVHAGLPEPVIRYEVRHEGAWVGTPDLAYVEEKIAIEYEGEGHRLDRRTYEDDIIRREMFRRAGWVVFLVTGRTLSQRNTLVGELKGLLRERGHDLESSEMGS